MKVDIASSLSFLLARNGGIRPPISTFKGLCRVPGGRALYLPFKGLHRVPEGIRGLYLPFKG